MDNQDFKECYNCGFALEEDEFIEHDGVFYCEDCFYEFFCTCEHCNNIVDIDDVQEVNARRGGVEWWCDHCRDIFAYYCDDCGRYFDYALTETHDVTYVCNDCLDNYYTYCDNCDQYYHNNDDNFNYDYNICDDCYNSNNLIHRYHDGPCLQKMGLCQKNWRGIWRGIGLELEIDKDEEDNEQERSTAKKLQAISGDSIYFERDRSLNNGFEIITQPHTIKEFYNIPWADILQACKDGGYKSHDAGTCGLHLHISRAFFGSTKYKQDNSISKLIYFIDFYYNDILKVSRRNKEEANRWAASYHTKTKQEAKEVIKDYPGRYYAVNNANRDTVEIRIMRGTLNINTFYATINFILTLAKNSKIVKWVDIEDCRLWLKGLQNTTIEYLKKRGAFGGVVCA